MKTIRQYLETLPEPYRTKAIKNVKTEIIDDGCVSLFAALCSFVWEDTDEGDRYWDKVYDYHWQIDCYKVAEKENETD